MASINSPEIVIKGARTNNLKDISLRIPHNKFIVVTGVSGSGKSSLVFEIIAKEGQRRYFETLPSFARQFMGKLNRPEVDEIDGLSPVIAIGQRTSGMHARSTVGTMSDIYDLLRLLFARTGKSNQKNKLETSRALFSFNSASGKCSRCSGIGKEEEIDLNKLITFPHKSIREGALAPTLPNGYIMYSQVTIEVLNQVCEAEGFNVNIPWNKLTDLQQKVVLFGSDKIKVPFGKHSLESRLKWTGIKAKPREEGFYKGMIPIMSDILRRDRNVNILKYVHAVTCPECHGARLNKEALSVKVQGKSIAEVTEMELFELLYWMHSHTWGAIASVILNKIKAQVDLLIELGLGHLTLDRPSKSLRASEIQRIRIANQILVPLSNVLYVFDEPSIGLHPTENEKLIDHFKKLVEKGNTVIVVEHDLNTIRAADHIIDIGPQAGINGGELLFNGSLTEFMHDEPDDSKGNGKNKGKDKGKNNSATFRALMNSFTEPVASPPYVPKETPQERKVQSIRLLGCHERGLKNINVEFMLGQFNVVSGRSGVGKSSLVKRTLLNSVREYLGIEVDEKTKVVQCENIEAINKLIFIDHSPIGKTPRSNPATYLGISDHIRDLFASLSESKKHGFTKSRFSFNNKGGRCESCQGAGKTQIGMHFLGNVDVRCGTCSGARFNEETLKVKYRGCSIAAIYKMSIDEAFKFFMADVPANKYLKKILKGIEILQEIGLGYVILGQSSTTLSGGEAQRIKIANQLQKKDTGDTLYIVIEPSIGLHEDNIDSLLQLFDRIKLKGNTIVCIEQNDSIIARSDWHIEFGPKSGKNGGTILHQGIPKLIKHVPVKSFEKNRIASTFSNNITLQGVSTQGLKISSVSIPKNQLTVVTGLSGSGKSSLVYDTLFAESNARFTESLSTYNRSLLQQNSTAKIQSFSGLCPAIGINRKGGAPSKRSTVGTLSGIYDAFRLLYSRIAQQHGEIYTAQHFSFNHHFGACPACKGLGLNRKCNPDQVIVAPMKSIFDGAVFMNKALGYYANVDGQFIATLQAVAKQKKLDLYRPWHELETEVKELILYGTGDATWNVTWEFNTKSRSGVQVLQAKWLGLCNYIDDEYQRRLHNKNIISLEELLHEVKCKTCNGSRLKPELLNIRFLGKNIHEISQLSIAECLTLIEDITLKDKGIDQVVLELSNVVLPGVKKSLQTILDLGLGYLNLDRAVSTLSGGERQRITLAGQLSTQLFGVLYVLDEPTIGLDEAQVLVLSNVLKNIIANGNTVVVVEHDPTFIRSADYLIEMGPGAGSAGGNIVYQGKVAEINKAKDSVTYKMFQAEPRTSTKPSRYHGQPFGIKGAIANNLKQINVDFFTHQITAITGVSGSGKSSLVKDVLFRSWQQGRPVQCTSLHGLEHFEAVLLIDQQALWQSRLSTPVTHTGIINDLKSIFSKLSPAKAAGFKKADFSYQSKKGKCSLCSGHGKLKTSMDFMSDVWLTCDSCKGLRYDDAILNCKYKNRSIGEVLQLSVSEAIDLFKGEAIVTKLELLKRVGVGHLFLGQAGNTLSGGEAQRLKLAAAMMEKRRAATLYLFDEPSTGLHYFDILKLIDVFESLIEAGDTVIFIEHNAEMIDAADRVLSLGPGSGDHGGDIVSNE